MGRYGPFLLFGSCIIPGSEVLDVLNCDHLRAVGEPGNPNHARHQTARSQRLIRFDSDLVTPVIG